MNKDVESLILMKLDDEDLERIGEIISKRVYEDDMFWKRRAMLNYPKVLEYKEQYAKTWKEYYSSLSEFTSHIYMNEPLNHYSKGRADFNILISIAEQKEIEIQELINAENDNWKNIISEKVCNPNIFSYLVYVLKDDEISKEYFINSIKYLINLSDKRIKMNFLLTELLYVWHNVEEMLEFVVIDSLITVENILSVLEDISSHKNINSCVMEKYLDFLEDRLLPQQYSKFLRNFIRWMKS